ncbi:MAG: hypothetical protein KKG60_01545 [Nanoarchaeota archaeon]|nr:hypothetical protein [Nanoarchaeota archaeon]
MKALKSLLTTAFLIGLINAAPLSTGKSPEQPRFRSSIELRLEKAQADLIKLLPKTENPDTSLKTMLHPWYIPKKDKAIKRVRDYFILLEYNSMPNNKPGQKIQETIPLTSIYIDKGSNGKVDWFICLNKWVSPYDINHIQDKMIRIGKNQTPYILAPPTNPLEINKSYWKRLEELTNIYIKS